MTKKQSFISRRLFLRHSAASILAAGLWPGARTALAQAGNAQAGSFDFAVVNDTHYKDARCGHYLTRAFAQIQAESREPELVLLAGDLATDGRKHELGPLKEILSAVKCPVYVSPGNHDYEPDGSAKPFDTLFPNRRNYVIEHKRWIILGYDSTDGVKWSNVAVRSQTLTWLDETLPKLDRGRPMIVFTHLPLGGGVPMRSTNADAVLRRFENHNLRAIFTGHHHGITEKQYGGIPISTNRCMALSRDNHDGSKEKGYFIARAELGKVSHAFREFLPEV